MTVQLPRLLDKNLNEVRRLKPVQMSVNLEIVPLSTVSMQLMKSDAVSARSFVEVFTSIGSVGIYRVRAPQESFGADTITIELEHAVTEVADYLVKDSIDKMMTAANAVKTVWKHYGGSRWKLGNTSALSGDVVLSAQYVTVLEALNSILDQQQSLMMDFDFTSSPWKINFVKKGTSVTAEGRLSRNVASAQVTYDDADLCTRVYIDGLAGSSGTKYGYLDGSTKSKYGIIEKSMSVSSDYTAAEIKKVAQTYLNDHKEPKISITIDAEDLSQITGETLDKFTLGKLFRLALPDYNTTVEQHITALSWGDVFNSPESVNVTLAQKKDTMLTFLHNVETGGGRGGSGQKKKTEEKFKEYRTHFSQTDREISLTAERVDKNEKILEQAGLKLNSKGVLIYAEDAKNGIMAKINTTASKIESKVTDLSGKYSSIEQTVSSIKSTVYNKNGSSKITQLADRVEIVVDSKGNVKPGKIVTAINKSGSSVTLSANKIYLDGETIASKINAVSASFANLVGGRTKADVLWTTNAQISTTLYFSGFNAKWKYITYLDKYNTQQSEYFLVAI